MLNFSLDSKDLDRKIDRSSSFWKSKEAALIMITAAESTVIPAARRNLRKNKSIFQGHLFQSLRAKVIWSLGPINQVGVGTFGVFYGKNIEEGTPKGTPVTVTGKLIRWAKIKLGVKNPVGTATRIARSIRMKGSPAKPFLKPAWEETKAEFYRRYVEKMKIAHERKIA